MFIRIFSCLSLLLCLPAGADQNDPRLDQFFLELKQTAEPAKGEMLTQSIWEVWYETRREDAQALFDSGVAAMNARDYQEAIVIFTQVTELYPDFAEGWNRRATLYYLVGELDRSIQDIKQTLLLEPRHFGAISGLGQIYLRQNKLLDARTAFMQALEINPHLINLRFNIEQINKKLSANSV